MKAEHPLYDAQKAAEGAYLAVESQTPGSGLPAALEAFEAVLKRSGLLWVPPEPPPALAVEEAAKQLALASRHNRYADADGWRRVADSLEGIDHAYAAAKVHLSRLGGVEAVRCELEAAYRLLLDHHRTKDTEGEHS